MDGIFKPVNFCKIVRFQVLLAVSVKECDTM
jgi:hypothetical protein